MQKLGLASFAMFYYDFREDQEKDLRGLLSSLLVQLCHQSDSYCDILFRFYIDHARGSQHPGEPGLILTVSLSEGLLQYVRSMKHSFRTFLRFPSVSDLSLSRCHSRSSSFTFAHRPSNVAAFPSPSSTTRLFSRTWVRFSTFSFILNTAFPYHRHRVVLSQPGPHSPSLPLLPLPPLLDLHVEYLSLPFRDRIYKNPLLTSLKAANCGPIFSLSFALCAFVFYWPL